MLYFVLGTAILNKITYGYVGVRAGSSTMRWPIRISLDNQWICTQKIHFIFYLAPLAITSVIGCPFLCFLVVPWYILSTNFCSFTIRFPLFTLFIFTLQSTLVSPHTPCSRSRSLSFLQIQTYTWQILVSPSEHIEATQLLSSLSPWWNKDIRPYFRFPFVLVPHPWSSGRRHHHHHPLTTYPIIDDNRSHYVSQSALKQTEEWSFLSPLSTLHAACKLFGSNNEGESKDSSWIFDRHSAHSLVLGRGSTEPEATLVCCGERAKKNTKTWE